MPNKAAMPMRFVKSALRGLFFRPGWYSGNYSMLERIFRNFQDPWNFESSPYEQERLDYLMEVVKRYPHNSILEVGCAEGFFTERVQNIARRIVAIDVSETAIERARKRAPKSMFICESLEDFHTDIRFDLVICSETLYYVKDLSLALKKLSDLGKYCLVSYLDRESRTLGERVSMLPLVEQSTFEKSYGFFARSMHVVVWKNDGVI